MPKITNLVACVHLDKKKFIVLDEARGLNIDPPPSLLKLQDFKLKADDFEGNADVDLCAIVDTGQAYVITLENARFEGENLICDQANLKLIV